MRLTALAAGTLLLVACPAAKGGGDGGADAGASCNINGGVVADGRVDPANPCRSCQVAVSTTAWSPVPTGTACTDPGFGAGFCNAGSCQPGCFIQGTLLPPGASSPSVTCQACVPALSMSSYSPATGLPGDGGCDAGEVCSTGTCTPGCFIDGGFLSPGVSDPTAGRCCNPFSDLDGGADGGLRGGSADWTPNFVYGDVLSTGSQPLAIVAGELTNQTHPDLVVLQASHSLTLFPNSSGVLSSPGTTYSTGIHPVAGVVADLNGDGLNDLAVVTSFDSLVGIFLNYGGGVLADGGSYPVPGASALALMIQNGVHDLAVAGSQGMNPNVSLLRNDGVLGFSWSAVDGGGLWATSAVVDSMATGDFNGDMILDLMVVEGPTNQVGLFLGDGDGGFAPRVDFNVGSTPVSGVAADFNGDGRLDFAVVNSGEMPGTVGVLYNDGDGGFGSMVRYTAGRGAVSLSVADFNGDHRLDLAVVNHGDHDVSLFLGLPDGGFSAPVLFPTGPEFGSVTADFNGDQAPDLALFGSTFVQLLINGCP